MIIVAKFLVIDPPQKKKSIRFRDKDDVDNSFTACQ